MVKLEEKVAKLTELVLKQNEVIKKLAKNQNFLKKNAQLVDEAKTAEPEIRSKLLNAVLKFGVTGLTLSLGSGTDSLSIEKVVAKCPQTADVFSIKTELEKAVKDLTVAGKKVIIGTPNFFVAEH